MKCLSVSQPFADLIVSGAKSIDLRGWSTRYRGDILIHSPRSVMRKECERFGIAQPVTGAIVGRATLVDVKRYHKMEQIVQDEPLHLARANLERKRYGFILANPRRLAVPVPQKGRLGLFEVQQQPLTEDTLIADIMDEYYRHQFMGKH